MNRRAALQAVLKSEEARWSSMSSEQLLQKLNEQQDYEVVLESKRYQVEVEILENTDEYIHVVISVDDGTLSASIFPATTSIICQKLKQ
ncbi:MAG TPA: hypothetical protein VHD85_07220 [Terracidiphilus sp.]|nr:hypothetical protein [Terracidiphilus sp.]